VQSKLDSSHRLPAVRPAATLEVFPSGWTIYVRRISRAFTCTVHCVELYNWTTIIYGCTRLTGDGNCLRGRENSRERKDLVARSTGGFSTSFKYPAAMGAPELQIWRYLRSPLRLYTGAAKKLISAAASENMVGCWEMCHKLLIRNSK